MKEIFEKRADIQAQIDYELIVTPSNQAQVDEFVEIMLEVALTRTPTMKIGRDAEYPTAFVQQRFNQLTSIHIEKVMDGIRENTTQVQTPGLIFWRRCSTRPPRQTTITPCRSTTT